MSNNQMLAIIMSVIIAEIIVLVSGTIYRRNPSRKIDGMLREAGMIKASDDKYSATYEFVIKNERCYVVNINKENCCKMSIVNLDYKTMDEVSHTVIYLSLSELIEVEKKLKELTK